jgi:hypothetical protein
MMHAGSLGRSTGHPEGQAGPRKLLQTTAADAAGSALNAASGLSNAVAGALGLTGLQVPGLTQQGQGSTGASSGGTGAAGDTAAGSGTLQGYLYRVSGLQGQVNAARNQATGLLGESGMLRQFYACLPALNEARLQPPASSQ